MRSFIVWYKIIHSCIGSVAHIILTYPNKDTIDKLKDNDEYDIYMAANIMYIANVVFAVAMASLLDRYSAKDSVLMKIIKYIGLSTGVIFFVLIWCIIYFDLDMSRLAVQDSDKQFEINLGMFDYNDSFSYKATALSSYSKAIFFSGLQLYRHIKYPNRINTIPILC